MKSTSILRIVTFSLIGLPLLFLTFKIAQSSDGMAEDTTSPTVFTLEWEGDVDVLEKAIYSYNAGVEIKQPTGAEPGTKQRLTIHLAPSPAHLVYNIDPGLAYRRTTLPYLTNYLKEGPLYPLSRTEGFVPDDGATMADVITSCFGMARDATPERLTAFSALLGEPMARTNEGLLRSAYFATLCRLAGIPAKVLGGIQPAPEGGTGILFWTEVRVGNFWIPFYPGTPLQNGMRKAGLVLGATPGEIRFLLATQEQIMWTARRPDHTEQMPSLLDAPKVAALTGLPLSKLMLLLMLPLAVLVVSIFKNIVGVKTFGIFLPALIALTLLETGFMAGVLLFTAMVMAVACVYRPLSYWGIQHNTKIALMLTIVVLSALIAVRLLAATDWVDAATPLFFPIVILTIVSERFAVKAEEENMKSALMLYGSTMMVTALVYLIISSESIQQFVLHHPESIITVAGIKLLLGRWTGIRITEYYRFYNLAK